MRWKLFFQFKNSKGQWFKTDKEDVKELKEEGIETDIIPWIEDDKN